jgi:ABC-type antimicrobial peptide transport system permease subunit
MKELGVRMALGARPARIVLIVVRQGAILVAVGMVLGFGAGGWLSQQMRLFLFGVEPWDPGVTAGIAAILAAAALTATLVPAARAASVDPMVALRDE